MPLRFLGDGLIGHRQKLLHRLEHRHLASQPPPDAAELEADDAGADHAEARAAPRRTRAHSRNRRCACRRAAPRSSGSASSPTPGSRASPSSVFSAPSGPLTSTLLPGSSRPWPWMPTTPLALNSAADAAGHGLDDRGAALLHLPRDRARPSPSLMPWMREFLLGAHDTAPRTRAAPSTECSRRSGRCRRRHSCRRCSSIRRRRPPSACSAPARIAAG